MAKVIALAVADIHLQHTPPVARSGESDWYEAMARPLKQLADLEEKYNVPVIIAGDIFTNWNSCPQLVNLAIAHFGSFSYRHIIAIPGQHDVPYHNLDNMKQSAFTTLCEADVIETTLGCFLTRFGFPDESSRVEKGVVHSSPWGTKITPNESRKSDDEIHIAVAHQYIWTGKHRYTKAPEELRIDHLKDKLEGYDVAIFGDNHDGFITKIGDCNVINCGCLIQRRADERDYKPMVGLIYDNGTIKPHYLDTSKDVWLEEEGSELVGDSEGLDLLLNELKELNPDSLDFREAIERYTESEKVDEEVRKAIEEAING
jgi:DNA repair exonuclease SbcCD nuclease subunit